MANEVRLDDSKYTHRRCARIMRNLEALGIVPLRTQLSVTLPDFKITTHLDGVGINRKNEIVVLEIKCTQFSIGDHEERYRKRCVGAAKLANGMDNSEFNIHQLQTA